MRRSTRKSKINSQAQQMADAMITYNRLKAQIHGIDPRFVVEPAVILDDADRKHPGIKVSMPHHVHGQLSNISPLSEGDLVLFWPRQKRALLDQTREEQIQEFADSINRSYEECEDFLLMKYFGPNKRSKQ